MKKDYSLKEKIKAGQMVLGCFLNFYSPPLVEILGMAGYDFCVLDNEHGGFSPHELESMIRAADVVDLAAMVRVDYDPSSIQKALDAGAEGIQVPKVNTRMDAETAVRRAKYPTEGERGVGFSSRSARLSREKGAAYIRKANESVLIVAQIETAQAIENIDEILCVSGIDVAFLGKMDLSGSLGFPQEDSNPAVQEMERRFYDAVQKRAMVSGIVLPKNAALEQAHRQGTRYVTATIAEALSSLSKTVKARDDFIASLGCTN